MTRAPLPLRAFAVALLGLGAGCGDALAPVPTGGRPTELFYAIGGFSARLTFVELAGDTVVATSVGVQSSTPPEPTRRVPTAEEWRAFWRAVDEAGVQRWPRQCPGDPLYDGPGLEFALAWAGGRRAGAYTASVPTPAGQCSTGSREAVDRFERAVFRVAGLAPAGAAAR